MYDFVADDSPTVKYPSRVVHGALISQQSSECNGEKYLPICLQYNPGIQTTETNDQRRVVVSDASFVAFYEGGELH